MQNPDPDDYELTPARRITPRPEPVTLLLIVEPVTITRAEPSACSSPCPGLVVAVAAGGGGR